MTTVIGLIRWRPGGLHPRHASDSRDCHARPHSDRRHQPGHVDAVIAVIVVTAVSVTPIPWLPPQRGDTTASP